MKHQAQGFLELDIAAMERQRLKLWEWRTQRHLVEAQSQQRHGSRVRMKQWSLNKRKETLPLRRKGTFTSGTEPSSGEMRVPERVTKVAWLSRCSEIPRSMSEKETFDGLSYWDFQILSQHNPSHPKWIQGEGCLLRLGQQGGTGVLRTEKIWNNSRNIQAIQKGILSLHVFSKFQTYGKVQNPV